MYKVYWTALDGATCSELFEDMSAALTQTNYLRSIGREYVAMVGENANQVGVMGVDSVKDGKLPSGEAYTWKMRRN
jgi:hypothetical protein